MYNKLMGVYYHSLLGTTKQYAFWLAEKLGITAQSFNQAHGEVLKNLEVVVVMSGTYAGHMPLVGFLKKHWNLIKDKEVIVVAVGVIPPQDPASIASYHLIPEEIRRGIFYVKLPGKLLQSTPAGSVRQQNLREVLEKLQQN